MKIEIKKLDKDAVIPEYATSGSAAVDLRANITQPVVLDLGFKYFSSSTDKEFIKEQK